MVLYPRGVFQMFTRPGMDADGVRQQNRTRNKRRLGLALSYAIAAACLYWAFRGIRFSELLHSLVSINWWWVPLAVMLDLLIYVCASWEWQLLLRSVGRVSFRKAMQAIFASRFANDVLPVRAGYV